MQISKKATFSDNMINSPMKQWNALVVEEAEPITDDEFEGKPFVPPKI